MAIRTIEHDIRTIGLPGSLPELEKLDFIPKGLAKHVKIYYTIGFATFCFTSVPIDWFRIPPGFLVLWRYGV